MTSRPTCSPPGASLETETSGLSGLKESLHIHLMKIVFFEINQIYFLGYGQMTTQEKKLKSILKGPFEPQHSTVITDVLTREFPICDETGGGGRTIWKIPGFFYRRESPSLKPLFWK